MTYGQLGWLDALAFAFGLLMEIPSGAISDMLGKRRTIIAGMFFSAIGTITMALAQNSLTLWVAFFSVQLGWALHSGASEALAYDSLLEENREAEYERVIATNTVVVLIMTVITTLLGGALYAVNYRFSHFAWGLAYCLGFIISWWLSEPTVDSEQFSLKNYFLQIKMGIMQLFKPMLQPYLFIILAVLGFDYLYSWGLIRPAMATQFGFFAEAQAILFAAFGLLAAIVVKFLPWLRKRISDRVGFLLLGGLITAGFLLSVFPLGYWGIVAMLCIETAGYLAAPWFSVVVNQAIDSKFRATTLSTLALLIKIPYVVLAVLAGLMIERGTFNWFLLGVGWCSAIVVIFSYFKRGRVSEVQ